MNAGVTVVLGIVGTLVLCEAVLPQASAALRALRTRRLERAKKAPGAAGDAPRAGKAVAVPRPPSAVREDAPERRTKDAGHRHHAADAGHQAPAGDEDLAGVYDAAKRGDPEAMVRLGEYACRRGAVVESFYWTVLAELNGMLGLDGVLYGLRTRWLAEGCPWEFDNDYDGFPEREGDFARAVLCLQCDVDPQYGRTQLRELADAGHVPAKLFLRREEEMASAPVSETRHKMRGGRFRT